MSQTYSFPVLSDQELLPCLKEMDLPLTAVQLSKPTYEIVRPVYENIVYTLMGITREELQQPVFAAIDTLEFPELHDESIPFTAFTKHLTQLMTSAGVKDFSLQDVCKPDAARLRRNLSAIINFAKFREEKLVPYTEWQEQTINLMETGEQLQELNLQLKEQLRKIQEARSAELPEVKNVESAINALHAENQQLNKQQMTLNNEARVLKNQTNTLTAQATELNMKLQNSSRKAERLRGQIVEAPEKLEGILKELQQTIDRERSFTTETERKARDLQSKLDLITRIEKEAQKAVATIEDASVEITRKKEASSKVKALKSEIQVLETEAAQLAAEHQHLQRQLASSTERMQRLETQSELRREAAVSAVDEQRRSKEAIEAENAANIAKLAEDEAAMRTLREKINELQMSHDNEVATVLENFHQVKKQVFQYHDRLEAVMGISDYTGQLSAIKPPR